MKLEVTVTLYHKPRVSYTTFVRTPPRLYHIPGKVGWFDIHGKLVETYVDAFGIRRIKYDN